MTKNEVNNKPPNKKKGAKNREGINKRQEETMELNAKIDSYILDNINKPKAEVLKEVINLFKVTAKKANENYKDIIDMLRDEEEIKDKGLTVLKDHIVIEGEQGLYIKNCLGHVIYEGYTFSNYDDIEEYRKDKIKAFNELVKRLSLMLVNGCTDLVINSSNGAYKINTDKDLKEYIKEEKKNFMKLLEEISKILDL